MANRFTWKLVLPVLLWAAAFALASCTTARTHLIPAESVDEFPGASPGYVTPAPPSQIQAP
jgi:hypothetical protein